MGMAERGDQSRLYQKGELVGKKLVSDMLPCEVTTIKKVTENTSSSNLWK